MAPNRAQRRKQQQTNKRTHRAVLKERAATFEKIATKHGGVTSWTMEKSTVVFTMADGTIVKDTRVPSEKFEVITPNL